MLYRWWVPLALLVVASDAFRYLALLPWPTRSHQRVFEPLLLELAHRGHNVILYGPYPIEKLPPNFTQVVLPDITPHLMKDMGPDVYTLYAKYPKLASFFMPLLMRIGSVAAVKAIMETDQFKGLISSDLKVDALILESGFVSEPYIGLKHKFNAINIEVLPSCNFIWAHWIFGNPYDSSFIADFTLPYTNDMGLWERVHSTFTSLMVRVIGSAFIPWYESLMDEHMRYPGWEERPPLWKMLAETSVVLANCHVATNYPNPVSSNFKEVGGLNIRTPEPLPQDLQNFMDNAKEGVIYFSVGSHIPPSKVLGDNVLDFVKAFGELKQKVLWKWDSDIPDLPENVRLGTWMPQQSILAHKKLRLFITHGGMLSLVEAMHEGVPLIGIPVLGDQMRNVKHMEHFGYGLPLYLNNVTHETISWSIHEVLNNPSYREAVLERQSLLKDEMRTPLENAVYWAEYAVRHRGAPHLRPAVSRLPWYQEALLDVYLTLALVLLLPLYLFYRITRCILSRCFSTRSENKQVKPSRTREKKKQQ